MNTTADRAPITAIVLTKNEAINIGPCLRSLAWVDDVVIVDSGSDDGTIAAARDARPDVRVYENPFEDFGQQRNWALDQTAPRHAWILFVDADERSNSAFEHAVRDAVASPGEHVGYYLCYRNFFLDRWIKRCTLYPSWQLRLLKRGEVRYRREGHGQREVTDGPLAYIREPYDHYGFSKGVSDWVARHNVYSTAEVELINRLRREPLALGDLFSGDAVVRRRCMKRIGARAPFRPWLRFVYLYVWRRGFLDGRAGLRFCQLRLAHELNINVKLDEAKALAADTSTSVGRTDESSAGKTNAATPAAPASADGSTLTP